MGKTNTFVEFTGPTIVLSATFGQHPVEMDHSPFRSILGTNHVPTERECGMITEFLLLPVAQLERLQARVAEQEAILQQLKEQCEDLQRDIKAHRAIISLIRRLPDDILREIFVYCLPHNRNPRICVTEPPLSLTLVCGRWRRVALSTPRLWSSLDILTYSDNAQIADSTLELRNNRALQWIGRTGRVPLSLSFSNPREGTHCGRDTKRLFSLLSPSFSRWNKLQVSFDGLEDDLLQIARLKDGSVQTPFHQVEQLSIRVDFRHELFESESDLQRKVQMFLSNLRLTDRNVRLRQLGLYLDSPISLGTESLWLIGTLPCDRLEVLDLQGSLLPFDGCEISIDILPSILQACPKLAKFSANIGSSLPTLQKPVATSRITLNSLQQASLFFPNWKDDCTLDFIARCDWPSLTSLYLRKENSSRTNIYLLSAVGDKFASMLTSLRLSSYGISPQTLTDLMFALPALVQLHLDHPSLSLSYAGQEVFEPSDESLTEEEAFDDVAITNLTPKPDGTPHGLPLLRFLKWERNTGFTDKALAHLLQQRSVSPYSPAPMKQVHILFGRAIQEDILPSCSNLIDAGLDLRLKYPPSLRDFTDGPECWKTERSQPLDLDLGTHGWD